MGISIELTEEQMKHLLLELLRRGMEMKADVPLADVVRRQPRRKLDGGEPSGRAAGREDPAPAPKKKMGRPAKLAVCAGCTTAFKKSLLSEYNGDLLCPDCLRKVK